MMNVFLCMIRAKLTVVGLFTAILVAVNVPSRVIAQITVLGHPAAASRKDNRIKIGPLPGTRFFHEKDVANASWFTKGKWAVYWGFLPKTFAASWPRYGYDRTALTAKCANISSNAVKGYKVGRGYLVSMVHKQYIGIPLRNPSNETSSEQLAKFAPTLAGLFDSKLKPAKIQFNNKEWTIGGEQSDKTRKALVSHVGKSLKPAKIQFNNKEWTIGGEQSDKTRKALVSHVFEKALDVYADNLTKAGRDAEALTVEWLCRTAGSLPEKNVLLATEYPVLDSKLTKRLTMGQRLELSN